jgi:group I intron endonuclease
MIGIYKITSPSNRIYIGQSVNIQKRFTSYKRMYIKNEKQTKLHRSFLKYGVENHKIELVCECIESELNNYERYYQELFNCLNNGLNCRLTKTNDKSGKLSKETLKKMSEISMGNQNWLGKTHTQETKDKISLANKGKKHSDEANKRKGRKGVKSEKKGIFSKHPSCVKVIQLDLNNNFIKEWNCLMDIKRELNYHIGNVSGCLKGRLKTYKSFKWKYKYNITHLF